MEQAQVPQIAEALYVIDKALNGVLNRELVASGEVADVLLDVRTKLTAPILQDSVEVDPVTLNA
jgi:hypothetical protein